MLPDGWESLAPPTAHRMIRVVEWAVDHGGIDLLVRERRHEKGYALVTLPRYHPFAQGTDGGRLAGNGQQLLHRYLVMRREGKVLAEEVHVHHPEGVPKDSQEAGRLMEMHSEQHGLFHRGEWQRCGAHVYDCPACQGHGCPACIDRGVIVERPVRGAYPR